VKLVAVPAFRKAKSIILVDADTLQSYEYRFDVSSLVADPPEEEEDVDMDNGIDKMDLLSE